jgi:hypothetical protein
MMSPLIVLYKKMIAVAHNLAIPCSQQTALAPKLKQRNRPTYIARLQHSVTQASYVEPIHNAQRFLLFLSINSPWSYSGMLVIVLHCRCCHAELTICSYTMLQFQAAALMCKFVHAQTSV